ncbi:leucine-rich repeat-containing protein 45 isoform X1 [Marmota marmota marmota]|uniref:leucine-rich repeat-containing protein 45 isoform X1 n=1 Tax=Marmota marmota marmota TaxID=9994 RepID=UPI000762BCAB|nr:leucine-rich repeat-containing protein 45 isoform X1 [Marmota marmota marmota]XP_015359518.1 leucine-rich repeat-containing protein 45 isoform X1 [Marmota marmota marmota]XP_048652976.1 leucine-rich repeat-containing protein 45 isoform X1 [Marmota marmota marmota]
MEEFRRSYSRLCKESGSEPQEAVLQQLHQLPRGRLDLATQSLTVDTCRALGKLLQNQTLLTELVLSDCMLSEEGTTLLLQGLCANTVIRFLDLKGNNLRAAGAEALGKLLRQNQSIQSLTLEWNNLGTWEDAFATFCGGLAANSTLQQLDLRNNQISHKGAEELALALKGNAILQQLDLRWNNVGLLGGRALVNCLPSNRTLWRLDLAGNNVPSDVLRAVGTGARGCLLLSLEQGMKPFDRGLSTMGGGSSGLWTEQAMEHNQDRHTAFQETQTRTHLLSKEVQYLQEEKSKQFLDLMETIDKQREEMARSSQASAARVGQLQEALKERHSIINALKAKLQMTEAALALSEQKSQDLGELLATAEQERLSLSQREEKERRLEQQEASERESKLLRDLSAANEKNLLLRNQVDELERKLKSQQEELFLTRQELTNISAELKIRVVQAEERLDMEKRRARQNMEDSEKLRFKEVEHMTRHLEESERAMQERLQRLEALRLSLEEELSRVKAAALSERGQAEEELIKARNQARLEEQQHLAHLEEKLRLLAQARDEAQGTCIQQKQTVAEAQARASQLSLQVEGQRRRIEELQQELSNKDQEKVAEVTRVRVELQEQMGRLRAELTAQETLREKVAALERQLKVIASDHREALLDKESENASLREKLRLKEAEIARIRDEEAQRASFLQNAVLAYVQGSPLRSLSPPK